MRRCLPDPVDPVRRSMGMIGVDIDDKRSSEKIKYYFIINRQLTGFSD